METLEDDSQCFICGQQNEAGLRLDFQLNDSVVMAPFTAKKIHQGYKNVLHGGIVCAILDEASVKAVNFEGRNAVTAELTVRFKNPMKVDTTAIVSAKVIKRRGSFYETEAKVELENGTLIALGQAKLFAI